MKTIPEIFRTSAALTLAGLLPALYATAADTPLRTLVVTGGHAYDTNEFRAVFTAMQDVTPIFVEHPEAADWLKADRAGEWDVLVLYDMWQPVTAGTRLDFQNRLREGKGLVAMHHSLANHQDWPRYAEIIGGRYHLEPWQKDGHTEPASTYQHDLELEVQVLNPWHPVTAGLKDFTIHDEGYGKLELKPTAKPLLAVRHPESSPVVAWTKAWEGARVAGIQLGHDRAAYANPAFQQLTHNAIRWVARRN
ncbi:MAG: ThuA domain-containing protein [Verrucomicrobiales bacterium]|nr:ThuA domain-containing protein [Verrucomicrobiales bacterium]